MRLVQKELVESKQIEQATIQQLLKKIKLSTATEDYHVIFMLYLLNLGLQRLATLLATDRLFKINTNDFWICKPIALNT